MSEYWIPKAIKSKSGLKKQLHVKQEETIRPEILESIKKHELGTHVYYKGHSIPVTKKLKKRATLALTLKNLQKKRRRY